MVVVDAGVLAEILTDAPNAPRVALMVEAEPVQAAPHLIDAEVLAVIQRRHSRGQLDATGATQAVDGLRRWPATRWSHRPFLERAWDLRHNVRAYDAMYVALAEFLQAPLLTMDRALARAPGLRCEIQVL